MIPDKSSRKPALKTEPTWHRMRTCLITHTLDHEQKLNPRDLVVTLNMKLEMWCPSFKYFFFQRHSKTHFSLYFIAAMSTSLRHCVLKQTGKHVIHKDENVRLPQLKLASRNLTAVRDWRWQWQKSDWCPERQRKNLSLVCRQIRTTHTFYTQKEADTVHIHRKKIFRSKPQWGKHRKVCRSVSSNYLFMGLKVTDTQSPCNKHVGRRWWHALSLNQSINAWFGSLSTHAPIKFLAHFSSNAEEFFCFSEENSPNERWVAWLHQWKPIIIVQTKLLKLKVVESFSLDLT